MQVKKIFDNPFYTKFQKHYCPKCNTEMTLIKVNKIVNSNSPEAIKFDFDNGENFMLGDVKFIWNEFKCLKCGFQISVKDLRRMDKEKKKKRR